MPRSHDAFLSYSHRVDKALAAAMERGLERLAKPLLRLRALDVFRDETSLSASPGVWPAIEAHLAASRWLVVLACPEHAASPWCGKEVAWWLTNRPREQLLIVLTDGAISWDAARSDFDWARTTALPRSLAGRLADEPLYVDLSWARRAEPASLTLKQLTFRDALVSLAAPIRGVDKDALDGEDVRQQARNRLFVRAGMAAIVVAAGVAVWQAKVAMEQRSEALAQRAEAVSQRDRAEKALAATQRELLRAQTAELRGLLQRVDRLVAQAAAQPGGRSRIERLEQERRALAERLERSTLEHQRRLAEAIGYRGGFDFLQRWEGNVGGVSLERDGATIDPQTFLRQARPEVMRSRYEFILTPDELDGVLALVGQQGDAALTAWRAHPALCRIRLQPADVARLVPEVAGEFWLQLIRRHPAVADPALTPAMQSALLSLAYNTGAGSRYVATAVAALAERNPAQLADVIEHLMDEHPLAQRFPVLLLRRRGEANLIRREAGLPVERPVNVPPVATVQRRGPGC